MSALGKHDGVCYIIILLIDKGDLQVLRQCEGVATPALARKGNALERDNVRGGQPVGAATDRELDVLTFI